MDTAHIQILLLSGPFQWFMFSRLFRYRREQQTIVDKRIRILSEVVSHIRAVKLYAYEAYFSERISAKREEEIDKLRKNGASRALTLAIMAFIPVLASLGMSRTLSHVGSRTVTFITYSLVGNALEPGTVFASLQLFNHLRGPMASLPMCMASVADAKAAVCE